MSKETTGKSMPAHRKISLTAGLLYLLTFVSIPTLSLYSPLREANFVLTNGQHDTSILVGALLEMVVGLACIGTAVALYQILKKQSQILANGLVAVRILEASAIFAGVALVLTHVALRQASAGADSLQASHVLSMLYDKTFLISQSFLPGINDLLLGYMLYKSGLVPRAIAVLGIVGFVPLTMAFVAMFFGGIEQRADIAGLAAIPVALFELSLGIWLVTKGFSTKAITKLQKTS